MLLLVLVLMANFVHAQKSQRPPSPLYVEKGLLRYTPDSLGNRIPDFSYCGYAASEEAIPTVPVKVVVPVTKGDATLRIQSALDYVATLPADKNGFRGAVLLQRGTYVVAGQLKLTASGVVLRGSGMGEKGTVLIGAGKDRETLIRVFGKNDKQTRNEQKVADAYVPVSATSLTVTDAASFRTGDAIIIRKPSTGAWIKTLGTDHFGGGITATGWKPGDRDLFFERKIVSIAGNQLTFDVPITTALDSAFGGGLIATLLWPGRIEKTGIENLALRSEYDPSNPKDEAHRWMAITLENVADAWVRQVTFQHFAGSAVAVLESAKQVTVEDCKSLQPVSEIGGQRRYSFFTAGQQTLFQRCYAEYGYHDFAVGFCAPGPNAFVQCQSVLPFSFSGTIDSWASGVLFDIVNVDGNALRFGNLGQDGNGAGWSAANSVFWQSTAARIDNYKPPTANNYSFGSWAQFAGDGWWESSNEQIQPRSLYYAQLAARLNNDVMARAFLLPFDGEASSSPPVEVAMALTKKAYTPAPMLIDWIDSVTLLNRIPITGSGVKTIDQVGLNKVVIAPSQPSLTIANGWLVRGSELVTGKRADVQWWSGGILPTDLPKAKPHLTRFVPGRTGRGLTDDLDSMTTAMQRANIVAMEHNYGLWYDRRRDDHERIRRMDGDVWAPFYELPFARSGKDTAWDGLSKYDLTRYNHWYWNRLKSFADLADQKGLLLVHQNYFQHNIIEAGAHYADFPWRTANNINNTPFPEPVPYAGDKRIFMAEQFYDVQIPAYRKLHTAYIRKCLDNFRDNSGVLQLISAEYTGPLHFVQFWLDTIKAWEKETGKGALVGLSTTKDVQDAILADPVRSAVVDVIDIRYWHYQENGTVYAPEGGQNLAPRQHARLLKPKRTSPEQVYRAVREYKQKFPAKAVMYSGDNWDSMGWAVLMAGGSLPSLPKLGEAFLQAAASMKPVKTENETDTWILKGEKGYIVYKKEASTLPLTLPAGTYQLRVIDPKTGGFIGNEITIANRKDFEAQSQQHGAVVYWLQPAQNLKQHESSTRK
ncbi:pectate lyase [Flavisolibacter sp. BT320]|nr:pectate lyase [Flavisolibacter longurius]